MFKPEAIIAYGLLVSLFAAMSESKTSHWVWGTFVCSVGFAVLWYWINIWRDGDEIHRWVGAGLYMFGMVLMTLVPTNSNWISIVLMAASLGFGAHICFPYKRETRSASAGAGQTSPSTGLKLKPLSRTSKTENLGSRIGQQIAALFYRSRK